MCVSGSVWTRSKFLGLSLGVHFVGTSELVPPPPPPPPLHPSTWLGGKLKGGSVFVMLLFLLCAVRLNLLDYGEEYTVTLPNAYGRYLLHTSLRSHPSGSLIPPPHPPTPPLSQVHPHCAVAGTGRQVCHRLPAEWLHLHRRLPLQGVCVCVCCHAHKCHLLSLSCSRSMVGGSTGSQQRYSE